MMASLRRRTSPRSEEVAAVTRLVLGLSAAVGGMAGGMGLVASQPMGWLVLPTVLLVVCLFVGATPAAAWAGAVIWAGILPGAHGEALLGPLLMIVACAAIAIGPDRFWTMVAHDFAGRGTPDEPAGRDWIEDA